MTYVYACLAGAGGGAGVVLGVLLALKRALPKLMKQALGFPTLATGKVRKVA